MTSFDVQAALLQCENELELMSVALVAGEPQSLASVGEALRQRAMQVAQLVARLSPAQQKDQRLQLRLKQLAGALALRRESLIRHAVLTERALNAVVPATCNATYAQSSGPYGAPGKRSGNFKAVAT